MATQQKRLFTNNASTVLASSLTNVATTAFLNTGDGALFPAPGTNEFFMITFTDASGNIEICKCTSRATDTLTIERAQEGTTGLPFVGGDAAELRNTKATMENFSQLNTPQEYENAHNFNATELTDAATIAWNLDENQVAKVTLGANRTLGAPTNMKDGGTYILRIIQDATGTRTLAFNSAFKFPDGYSPPISTAANAIDIMSCISDGTNMYCSMQNGFA